MNYLVGQEYKILIQIFSYLKFIDLLIIYKASNMKNKAVEIIPGSFLPLHFRSIVLDFRFKAALQHQSFFLFQC